MLDAVAEGAADAGHRRLERLAVGPPFTVPTIQSPDVLQSLSKLAGNDSSKVVIDNTTPHCGLTTGDNIMTVIETTSTNNSAEFNGVPTAKLFGTIAKLRDNGDLAAFRFSARNEWVEGTASASTIYEWYGAGADQVHVEEFRFAADHPTLGHGHGPTPQEYVLHALAACITAGIATGAAARGIELRSVSSIVSGDIDVRGVLGIDPDIRKGFGSVGIEFDIDADASSESIDALLASATKYSAVFDMLVNPTSVEVSRRSPGN